MQVLTVVSSGKLLRSRVFPEGTATFDKMIVEQDFCETLAEDAPLEPEKVQLVALLSSKFGAGVMAGSATGFAMAQAVSAASTTEPKISLVIAIGYRIGIQIRCVDDLCFSLSLSKRWAKRKVL